MRRNITTIRAKNSISLCHIQRTDSMKYFQAQLNGTIAFPALLHQKASSALPHYKVVLIIIICKHMEIYTKTISRLQAR